MCRYHKTLVICFTIRVRFGFQISKLDSSVPIFLGGPIAIRRINDVDGFW
jgi:hypothetical protein